MYAPLVMETNILPQCLQFNFKFILEIVDLYLRQQVVSLLEVDLVLLWYIVLTGWDSSKTCMFLLYKARNL